MNSAHIACGVIATNQQNKILMVKEGKDHIEGTWNFPGGSMEKGESVEECACREFKEETGYNIELGEIIGIYFEESVRTGNTVTVFMFSADLQEKKQKRIQNGEILDTSFFTPKEVKELELRKENRLKMLEDYQNEKSFSTSRIVDTRE